jgi:hypothetical protein
MIVVVVIAAIVFGIMLIGFAAIIIGIILLIINIKQQNQKKLLRIVGCSIVIIVGMVMAAPGVYWGIFIAEQVISARQWEKSLIYAVKENDFGRVETLLINGADPNEQFGTYDVLPLVEAIWKNNYEMVKLLVEYGADFNYTLHDGRTILESIYYWFEETEDNRQEIIDLLIEKGAE